jgi:hypothetical protein
VRTGCGLGIEAPRVEDAEVSLGGVGGQLPGGGISNSRFEISDFKFEISHLINGQAQIEIALQGLKPLFARL